MNDDTTHSTPVTSLGGKMKFKNGIWRGALANSRLNLVPLFLVTAISLGCYLAADFGSGGGVEAWISILVWLYLAIPAHFTALNGQSGWQTAVDGQFSKPFLLRAGVLSVAGLLGLILAIPLLTNVGKDHAFGVGILVYAATEIVILSFIGTWLPSVIAKGDTRIGTAWQRGLNTFWYIFLRLLFCNGLLLAAALFVFGALIEWAGYDKMYTSGTGFHPLVIVAYLVMVPAFSFHVVLLATILSRAYLIAEEKMKTVPSASSIS